MNKAHWLFLAGFMTACGVAQAVEPEVRFPKKHFDFFDAYCLDCHDTDTQKGKVDLETLSFNVTSIEQAELWQKVLNAMNAGEMPPEKKTQPKNAEKADFLEDLAQTMVLARKKLSDSGGQVTIRRLNRREYQNTIESLTGVRLNVDSLPPDGGSGTFDTVGASQFISSDQFEQYLALGRTAIDEAFVRHSTLEKPTKTFRMEPEESVNPKNLKIIKKLEETYEKKWLPWKEGVDRAVEAPENKEIVAGLRKKHRDYDSSPFLKYQKADFLKGYPDPRKYGGNDPINAVAVLYSGYRRWYSYMQHYAKLPHNDRGSYLKLAWGVQRFDIRPDPKDVPPGTYKLRIRVAAVKGSDPPRHFIQIGHPQKNKRTSKGFAKLLSTQQVSGTLENPEIIEISVVIGANTHPVLGVQERQPKKSLLSEFDRHKKENGYGTPPAIWVDWMELEGPIKENQAPELEITRVEPEKTINPANEEFIKQVEARQERFKQWKKGVDEAAKSPENQAIIAEIRKTDRLIDHPNRFYGYAEHFKGAPDPSEFGFLDSKKAAASDPSRSRNLALHKHYASLPHRDTGTYLKLTHGTGRVIVPRKKKELQPGNYVVRVRVGVVKGTPASRRFIEVGHPQRDIDSRDWGLKGKPISVRQVTGTIEAPQIIEFPVELRSGMPQEFAVQEKQPNTGKLKVLWDEHNKLKKENGYGHPPAIWIDWVELEGPHNPNRPKTWKQRREVEAGLASILDGNLNGTEETQEERARDLFHQFCVEAFRQVEPDPKFIDQLIGLFKTRKATGEPFDVAIRTPMSVILASPGFIYLDEPKKNDSKRTLIDRELAVRLAYFLWSSPPDAKLFDLAKRNELSNPAVLRQQVDRMIADPRSEEFVAGFVHQWLHMERLDFFQFDTKLHREFDESVRSSARQEVYESFALLMRDEEEGRLGKLLKSDYVMINGLLGTYYGIDGVNGDHFRKVSLPNDSPRGGLLGTAAVLAMGSDGIESSPVERGAWVLRYLLNDPPPPAPANVPQLSRLDDKSLTTRERLRAHQEEAQCASCHRKIDPIGFGLENFTAAGKWRTQDGHGRRAYDIDPSGKFHNGPEFANYFELRDRIAERENDFARGFTEALIGYGLGRPFGFTDEDLAIEMMASAKNKKNSVSEFIHALVQSKAFATK